MLVTRVPISLVPPRACPDRVVSDQCCSRRTWRRSLAALPGKLSVMLEAIKVKAPDARVILLPDPLCPRRRRRARRVSLCSLLISDSWWMSATSCT